MHAVSMNVLPQEYCKEQIANTDLKANTVDGTICTTPKGEQNNVCETDVGGPLACENENGFYELAGIYSQDTGCQATNQVKYFFITYSIFDITMIYYIEFIGYRIHC